MLARVPSSNRERLSCGSTCTNAILPQMTGAGTFGRVLGSHIRNTVAARYDCAHIQRGRVFLVADMAPPFQFPTRTHLHQHLLQLVFVPLVTGSLVVLNAVTQLNQPILEAFDGVQIHAHVAVTPRNEWNAIPNEHRDDTDDERVDRMFVKKGGDELTATHQPDILTTLLPKTAHECADCTVHE